MPYYPRTPTDLYELSEHTHRHQVLEPGQYAAMEGDANRTNADGTGNVRQLGVVPCIPRAGTGWVATCMCAYAHVRMRVKIRAHNSSHSAPCSSRRKYGLDSHETKGQGEHLITPRIAGEGPSLCGSCTIAQHQESRVFDENAPDCCKPRTSDPPVWDTDTFTEPGNPQVRLKAVKATQ